MPFQGFLMRIVVKSGNGETGKNKSDEPLRRKRRGIKPHCE
jgi:hypothetical protein